jgi:hypothetical protein
MQLVNGINLVLGPAGLATIVGLLGRPSRVYMGNWMKRY